MKKYLLLIPILLEAALACSRIETDDPYRSVDLGYGRDLSHGEIVLGDKLENPYKTINIQAAYAAAYPTKARMAVETTDFYVRFLPASDEEYARLEAMDLTLVDHPIDYEIVTDGDWYHDGEIADEDITWQYAVVPKDFEFPSGIRYEILDECFLSEHMGSTRAGLFEDVDWDEVERLSYEMTGNSGRLQPATKADSDGTETSKAVPSGRITIIDPSCDGGKPVGVAGVTVVCNSFVKFDKATTDRDGYYTMNREFSSELNYRLMFKNEKGFSIGFNLLLVPASVSTLGKADPTGVNMTVTSSSETKLYTRSVVNNAAYEYLVRAGEDDLNLPAPPSDIRIWIFNKLEQSSTVMMHHGTVVDQSKIAGYLGAWASLVSVFAPDITIGTAAAASYADIYSSTVHEMAHASHFSKAGKSLWDDYIFYILQSYATTGDSYGTGTGDGAGICEIGESWAYYLESKLYQQRYGGTTPSFGTSWWFHPQIFRYLDERGLTPSEMAAALDSDVASRNSLKDRLISLYPSRKKVIEQVFNRYSE